MGLKKIIDRDDLEDGRGENTSDSRVDGDRSSQEISKTITGLDEDTLKVYYWDGTQWVSRKTDFSNPTDAIVFYGRTV